MYYIHAPDSTIPLLETLHGINAAFNAGYFRRFGPSNYTAAEVEELHALCKEHNYPLPTVYQGNYSAVARRAE
jgi:aflatoxin B1 aldehyde reductase